MVKIKYSKRTQPLQFKKTVCVYLPKLDYDDLVRERRRPSLSNASSCRGDSPKITAIIKPKKKRLRVKKEPPCIFHSEVDINNEGVAEEIPGVLREPRNNNSDLCFHDVTRSMCYMCSPVPEEKAAIWAENGGWSTATNTETTSTASSSDTNEPCNEIRSWHTPVTNINSTIPTTSNAAKPRDQQIQNWHTPVVNVPLLSQREAEIVELEENVDETPIMMNTAVGAEVSTSIVAAVRPPIPTVERATQTGRSFGCKYCPASFSDFMHLMHHKSVHQKMLECVFCSAHFNAKNDLKSHLKVHMLPKHYDCVYCTQTFTKKHDIKDHLALHIEQRLYHCLTCPAIFTQKNLLRLHEKSHSICHKFVHVFKKFRDDAIMEPQIANIAASQPLDNSLKSSSFVPEDEGNTTSSETVSLAPSPVETTMKIPTGSYNSVADAMKSNVGLKFYNCENCSLSYSTLGPYKKHRKCHTRKVGKFVCGSCGARFLKKFHLTMHERAAHKVNKA